jgi:hypothetical protein
MHVITFDDNWLIITFDMMTSGKIPYRGNINNLQDIKLSMNILL